MAFRFSCNGGQWVEPQMNVSATLNAFRILRNPSLCLPQVTVSTFNNLPIPISKAFIASNNGEEPDIRAVVLDKDNCFARPKDDVVYKPYDVSFLLIFENFQPNEFPQYKFYYILFVPLLAPPFTYKASKIARHHWSLYLFQEKFQALRSAYPNSHLLIVSNSSGSSSDPTGSEASRLESTTGVKVLRHPTKKPGCGAEILEYFRNLPNSKVTRASQIAVVGDRLFTDVLMANMMGAWGVWVRDGVVKEKNLVGDLWIYLEGLVLIVKAVFEVGKSIAGFFGSVGIRGSKARRFMLGKRILKLRSSCSNTSI